MNYNKNQKTKKVKLEGNIIENLPIIYSHKTNLKELKKTISLNIGTLTIRYHKDLGPLVGFDLDTLIATSLICAEHGYTQKFPATAQRVRETLKLSKCGENINRVGESLLRLAGTFLQFHGSFYDFNNHRYAGTAAFHILSYYFFSKAERKNVTMKELFENSFIEWDSLVYTNLMEGYFKYINTEIYFSLPSGITRGTYLYLEKRLGKKEFYSENLKNLIKNITHEEKISKRDLYNFKTRTLEHLKEIYRIEIKNKLLTISRKHQVRQLKFPIKIPRPELSAYEQEVLDVAVFECKPKDEEYFKNTIKKFMRTMGPERVRAAITDTLSRTGPQPLDRYLITLLKESMGSLENVK